MNTISNQSQLDVEGAIQIGHENLVLSILISALDDDPNYIDTADCKNWCTSIGLEDEETIKIALSQTNGKVNHKNYITEIRES
jgi:hypothetical protein